MTPSEAIAALDRQVAKHGQTVVLRRMVANGTPVESEIRAFVRGYKISELVGGIMQGDSLVVISPTSLIGTHFATIPLRAKDKVDINGRERTLQPVDVVSIDDVVVRLNLTVRG